MNLKDQKDQYPLRIYSRLSDLECLHKVVAALCQPRPMNEADFKFMITVSIYGQKPGVRYWHQDQLARGK